MGFCDDFAWGAATSAYQLEGGAYEDGKGLHIWDVFCREPGRIRNGQTGDTACDHYHRFREDVAIMKELGLRAYRFSLSWARILPEGTGNVNEKGIAFYNNLIDALLEAGIEPYITLFHWDYPYALFRKGAWLNEDSPKWFGEYAKLAAERFSDRVSHFITLNEPQCFIGLAYLDGVHAPGTKAALKDTFLMAHHVLKAHGMAVRMLREYGRQPLQIGYAPTGSMSYPDSGKPEDIEAAREHLFAMPEDGSWTWNVSFWSDPVLKGEYPQEALRRYGDMISELTEADRKLIMEPIDFYGQNIYNGCRIRCGENGRPEIVKRYPGFPKTAMSWPVTPECLYWGPRFLYERYGKPIYITENGLSCHDVISLDGKVHDPDRIDFLHRYLRELRRAAEDGVDIRGYFQWSLLDNFEWHSGYEERFGLIYVDYRTQERIWKDSAWWYKDIIQSNGDGL